MSTYTNKTQPTIISPEDFIKQNANPTMVVDCLELLKIFAKITGKEPVIGEMI